MDDLLRELFLEPMQSFYLNVIHYLPNIMSFVLVLVAGLVMGKLLKLLSLYLFRLFRVDALWERSGLKDVLLKGGVKETLSVILARVVGYSTVFVFLIIALRVLEIPEVEHLLRTFFLYLPNVLVAAIILFLGYLLSNFLGRAALIAAVNSEIRMSGLIGKLVRFGVFLLASTMALEQLGIGKETIIIAFAIIFGGVVLSLAIAFGLGGKDLAARYLEGKLGRGRDEKGDEIKHI